MAYLAELLHVAAVSFQVLVLARLLLSWAPVPIESEFTRFVRFYTEPLLAPLRVAVPARGGVSFDLSPLFALALIHELERLAVRLVSMA